MIILAHRLRGHRVEPFKVFDLRRPWRWQCSCGKVFGGGVPFRHPVAQASQEGSQESAESIIESRIDLVKTVESVRTDIINTVQEKSPDVDSDRPGEGRT